MTHQCAFPIVTASTRVDGYDHDQQLARAVDKWLDDLALAGCLAPEDRRRIRFSLRTSERPTSVMLTGRLDEASAAALRGIRTSRMVAP